MMDYTNGKDENFIRNFKEKDGKIIINFAHKLFRKNKLVVDRTQKNKDRILNTMENQVSYNEVEINKRNKIAKWVIYFSGLFFVSALILAVNGIGIAPYFIGMMLATGSAFTHEYIRTKDCLKNIEFLNNQEKLNNSLKEHDSIMIDNMKDKTAKIIYDKSDKGLNINDIDKLSYNELKQLLDVIKKMKSLGFEESEGQIGNDKIPKLELKQE